MKPKFFMGKSKGTITHGYMVLEEESIFFKKIKKLFGLKTNKEKLDAAMKKLENKEELEKAVKKFNKEKKKLRKQREKNKPTKTELRIIDFLSR